MGEIDPFPVEELERPPERAALERLGDREREHRLVAPRRRPVARGDGDEAGRVALVVLDPLAQDGDAVDLGRERAPDGGPTRVEERLAHRGRGRRGLDELRLLQVSPEPDAALREGLGVGVDALDRAEGSGAEETVRDGEDHLAAEDDAALEERVDRPGHGAFARVLDRDDTVEGGPTADGVEHARNRRRIDVRRREAERATGGEMRIRPLRPEERDGERRLHRHRRAHHLAKDAPDRVAGKGASALVDHAREHRPFALGVVGGGAEGALLLPNLRDDRGASGEQREQLVVDSIDVAPEVVEGHGLPPR